MATVHGHTALRTSPGTAAVARDAVRELLDGQRPPVPAAALADALLVVSELATNALRHAGGITVFGCAVRDDALEVTVEDASDRRPTAHPADPRMPGGHGWPLVCRLAAEVTVTGLPGGGKRVSALVPLR
ncbi:ATP-binding protein [Streptomyces sp. NPDC021098]|uniref:ATP-binding protein n=1 Tax=unclassified Streptomyces TaxID=2593676 RepID=UPI00379281FA